MADDNNLPSDQQVAYDDDTKAYLRSWMKMFNAVDAARGRAKQFSDADDDDKFTNVTLTPDSIKSLVTRIQVNLHGLKQQDGTPFYPENNISGVPDEALLKAMAAAQDSLPFPAPPETAAADVETKLNGIVPEISLPSETKDYLQSWIKKLNDETPDGQRKPFPDDVRMTAEMTHRVIEKVQENLSKAGQYPGVHTKGVPDAALLQAMYTAKKPDNDAALKGVIELLPVADRENTTHLLLTKLPLSDESKAYIISVMKVLNEGATSNKQPEPYPDAENTEFSPAVMGRFVDDMKAKLYAAGLYPEPNPRKKGVADYALLTAIIRAHELDDSFPEAKPDIMRSMVSLLPEADRPQASRNIRDMVGGGENVFRQPMLDARQVAEAEASKVAANIKAIADLRAERAALENKINTFRYTHSEAMEYNENPQKSKIEALDDARIKTGGLHDINNKAHNFANDANVRFNLSESKDTKADIVEWKKKLNALTDEKGLHRYHLNETSDVIDVATVKALQSEMFRMTLESSQHSASPTHFWANYPHGPRDAGGMLDLALKGQETAIGKFEDVTGKPHEPGDVIMTVGGKEMKYIPTGKFDPNLAKSLLILNNVPPDFPQSSERKIPINRVDTLDFLIHAKHITGIDVDNDPVRDYMVIHPNLARNIIVNDLQPLAQKPAAQDNIKQWQETLNALKNPDGSARYALNVNGALDDATVIAMKTEFFRMSVEGTNTTGWSNYPTGPKAPGSDLEKALNGQTTSIGSFVDVTGKPHKPSDVIITVNGHEMKYNPTSDIDSTFGQAMMVARYFPRFPRAHNMSMEMGDEMLTYMSNVSLGKHVNDDPATNADVKAQANKFIKPEDMLSVTLGAMRDTLRKTHDGDGKSYLGDNDNDVGSTILAMKKYLNEKYLADPNFKPLSLDQKMDEATYFALDKLYKESKYEAENDFKFNSGNAPWQPTLFYFEQMIGKNYGPEKESARAPDAPAPESPAVPRPAVAAGTSASPSAYDEFMANQASVVPPSAPVRPTAANYATPGAPILTPNQLPPGTEHRVG